MAQKNEKSGEELPAETAVAVAAAQGDAVALSGAFDLSEMEGDKGLTQHFDAAQLIIPRLLLLQDLSPQVKDRNAEYVPGAKPGLFHNSVTKALSPTVMFIPAHFVVRYIAWRPRLEGGGLVDQGLTLRDVTENFDQVGIGSWAGRMAPRKDAAAVNVEVKETPEWVGMCKGETWDWMPMAISFPGTKSKTARGMNTEISLMKLDGARGKFTPPSFYHQYLLTSGIEKGAGTDEWYGFIARRVGFVQDRDALQEAKQLKIDFERGDAVVADSDAGLSQDTPA